MPIRTLQIYSELWAHFIEENFILMHDNARPHIARCVVEYLQKIEIQVIDRPPWSPDMNLIEHAWDKLGRDPVPEPLNNLKIALKEEWENIGDGITQNLMFSMPRRVCALLMLEEDA